MAIGEEPFWRCIEGSVCPLASNRDYGYGRYFTKMYPVCEDLSRCWIGLCTRTEVQDNRGREKLVKEKESHIEQSVSLSSHTHTHATCPYCLAQELSQDPDFITWSCDNCLSEFYLVESGA